MKRDLRTLRVKNIPKPIPISFLSLVKINFCGISLLSVNNYREMRILLCAFYLRNLDLVDFVHRDLE